MLPCYHIFCTPADQKALFTQNGFNSLECLAAQHCVPNWRRFFISFPENKTFFQIKLLCTLMVWRDTFWISPLSSVFLVQLSNVSPQPAFCPNYDCSDCKIMGLFLASPPPFHCLPVNPGYLGRTSWLSWFSRRKKPRQNWSRDHFEATPRAKFSILKPNFWSGDAAMGMAHWHNPNKVNLFSNIL